MNWFQNFVSLWSETVNKSIQGVTVSCELVSKFCIFVIWNSYVKLIQIRNGVVNWFQNFVSLWSETVHSILSRRCTKLWIGFKILYLCDLKQYSRRYCWYYKVVNWFQNFVSLWSETVFVLNRAYDYCCELVSKFCIFVVWNSLLS